MRQMSNAGILRKENRKAASLKTGLFLLLLIVLAAVCSVQAGAEITWEVTDGVLTISGTGDMPDYDYGSAPWGTDITEVIIQDGVTSIGSYAFFYCSSLTSISIPDGVTSIGDSAFYNCSSLTSISIPDSMTSIGATAFYDCNKLTNIHISNIESWLTINYAGMHSHPNVTWASECHLYIGDAELMSISIPEGATNIADYAFSNFSSLTSITIPEGVTSIGEYAFKDCSSLTSITIPESVTSIGVDAFRDCEKLTDIHIGSIESWLGIEYAHWSAHPNAVGYSGCHLFVGDTEQTSIMIQEGVTSIGDYAFRNCSSLTSINIPEGVTSIGDSAFYGCRSLTSINIPEGVTSIGSNAFNYCEKLINIYIGSVESWLTIDYADDYSHPNSWWRSEYHLFVGDDELTSITIPEGVTSIGDYAFYECSSLTSINIPDGVTSIGKSAFEGCSSLTSINIPEGVTSIGDAAFYSCSSLTSITIPEGVTSIGVGAFTYCSSLTSITIPEGVTNIKGDTFANCSSLTSISIPESVTRIDKEAFDECKKLTNIYIGSIESWLTIDCVADNDGQISRPNLSGGSSYHLFIGDTELTSISIPDGVTSIADYAFSKFSSLTSITIPEGVTSIGKYAFKDCSSLTSITIPESVTSIGINAFRDCEKLTNIYIGSIESWLTIDYAHSYYSHPNLAGSSSCHLFIGDTELTSITIPSGVTSIGDSAFEDCGSLTSITIAEGVASIGDSAFEDCSSLTNITIAEGVASIGDYAFKNCSRLTSVTIPNSVKSIGDSAFENCSSLTSITIAEGVTSIGEDAFANCSSLTSVTIPVGVTSIGLSAFKNCNSLMNVKILEGVTSIGKDVFANCSSLTSISIPESVMSIEDGAFEGCEKLTDIHINSIESWLTIDYADYESSPNLVGNTGCHLFIGDNEQTSIIIPEGVTDIRWAAFANFSSLASISISDGVTSIGWDAFWNCSSLTSISIPESVTGIGSSAFENCSSLTSISIPESVTGIGDSAFENCSNLTSISIPESVTSIGVSAFEGCGKLTNIHIGSIESWLKIDYGYDFTTHPNMAGASDCHLFIGDTELTSISIPDGVTSIGDYVFANCSSLTSITIPESVTSIGVGAFWDCSNLTSISIPDEVKSIEEWSFYNCSSLTSISIPESVTGIGDSAFENCSSLPSITIPESVTSIGEYAFKDCSSLTSITIPESVTSIGKYAFSYCHRLENVLFETTDENQNISFDFACFESGDTIYCHMYTAPHTYFSERGYRVVLLEDIEDINSIRAITLPKDFRMPCGDSKELAYDVFPKDDEPIVWTSSDPEILTVSEGVVTALIPGKATVMATVGTVSESLTIHTFISASGIELNKSEAWLQASREGIQLSVVSYIPENTSAIISWSTSDTALASVSADGYVTTKKPGDVTVTATTEKGVTASCLLHLTYPVTSLTLEAPSTMYMGAMRQVTSTARTSKGESYINKLVTFTSGDESVAVIDEEGMITAISPGTVTITASAAGGKTAEVEITVLRASSPTFPAKLTVIEDEAFAGTPFQIVVIPDGVTSIGSRAFADCPNLISVRIPASVTNIAEDAFEGCPDVIIQREGQ